MTKSNNAELNEHLIDPRVDLSKPVSQVSRKGSGRPKGSKNRKTIVREVAHELNTVAENGKPCKRSTLELVFLKLRNMALEAKNVSAFNEFYKLCEIYQPQIVNSNVGYLVAPAEMTPEEWLAEAEEANKTAEPPEGCFDP